MRILIINANQRENEFLKLSFKEQGQEVCLAKSGEAGISLAYINAYDLILVDAKLPDIKGDDFFNILRKKEIYYPVIVMSPSKRKSQIVKYLDLGADDYIIKPFELNILMARSRAVLRRPYRPYAPVHKIAGFIVDIPARTCFEGAREILLTKKEFSLLEFLIYNKNKVASRGFILEHVWDINADPFSNSIETHILNLRRKMGDNRDKKIIVTVPGVGYKLCCD